MPFVSNKRVSTIPQNKHFRRDPDEVTQCRGAMLKGGELPACQTMCGRKVKDWASRYRSSCVAAGGLFCQHGLEIAQAEKDITDNGRHGIYSVESKKHCDENRKHDAIRLWHLQRREERGLHCKGPQPFEEDGRWDVCGSCIELASMEPEAETPAPKKRQLGEWPACRNACGSKVRSPDEMHCESCFSRSRTARDHLCRTVLDLRCRNADRAEFLRRSRVAAAAGGKAELPLCQSSCGKTVNNAWSRFC